MRGPWVSMPARLVHPYPRGREALVDLGDSDMGGWPMPNIVPRLSESPGGFRRPAPKLGEHTREIRDELGL